MESLSLEILSCPRIFHVSSTFPPIWCSEPLVFYFYPVRLTAEAGALQVWASKLPRPTI
jgi:hypothetical protein